MRRPYFAEARLLYDLVANHYPHDRALLDLVSRIKCFPSDEAETPDLSNLCELEIVLKSGARKTFRTCPLCAHSKALAFGPSASSKARIFSAMQRSRKA